MVPDECLLVEDQGSTQARLDLIARRTQARLDVGPPAYGHHMADGWCDVTARGGAPWESLSPGPDLARVLAAIDSATLAPDARVSYLAATDRLAGWVHVLQAHALVSVSDAVEEATSPGPGMSSSYQQSCVADEVAAALHVAPRTASYRVNAAAALVRDWPLLGLQVAAGKLTIAQAREIAQGVGELSGVLDEDGLDLSERAVAGLVRIAADLPPARLRERVARVVASLDPAAATRRREQASRDRTDVSLWFEGEGLACLAVRGPAPDVMALRELIDARAHVLRDYADPADERTSGQWRFAAALSGFGIHPVGTPPVATPETGVLRPVTCEMRVTVPFDTLLGLAETPGELEGYGPLDPELVRELAADADWRRWVTDPVGDVLLDEGRRRFPGARLARFLRARESRCKHPVCGVRSSRCDSDHLPSYADGGTTSARDMSPTCPRHNRHRGEGGWQVAMEGPRDPMAAPDPTWISPLGRRYSTHVSPALHVDYIPRRT